MNPIAIDIETYDPNLKDLGDGSCRHDGRILCVGMYAPDFQFVFDFDNQEHVRECKKILESDRPKIFHNGVYDLAWLCCGYDFKVNGTLHDTMTRAVFIDEYQDLDLDSCCRKLGLKGKNKNETIEVWYSAWSEKMRRAAKLMKKYGCDENNVITDEKTGTTVQLTASEVAAIIDDTYKKSVWANALTVWADPEGRKLMTQYNLQDCKATYELFQAQEPLMTPYLEPYQVECDLYPLIIQMKKVGVRLDTKKLDELTTQVDADCKRTEQILIDTYGITGEMVASTKQLGKRLNEMGIHSPVITKTGAESWAADAINRIHHPVVPAIAEYKNYVAVRDKYLHGSLRASLVQDRIHCTFSPNKREEGGTVTGRFACSKPNLQNIPARDKSYGHNYGQDMRALFLPEEGCMIGAFDYSQIEYLLLAHFAVGPQAKWFREQANAGVDFHKVAMQATEIPSRQVVKTFNYGVIYGMGWKTAMIKNYNLFEKLAAEHNEDIETFTQNTYNNYHAKLPVIRDTMNSVQAEAKFKGYVTTLGGRREHKPHPQWDPATGKINDFMYKMLNKLIQGTAADILKYALRTAYKAGIFDVLTFHITVHDENVVSIPFNKVGTDAAIQLKEIMDNSFKDKLLVPMKACVEVGPNWGYWSDDIWEDMKKYDFNPEYFNKNYKETH